MTTAELTYNANIHLLNEIPADHRLADESEAGWTFRLSDGSTVWITDEPPIDPVYLTGVFPSSQPVAPLTDEIEARASDTPEAPDCPDGDRLAAVALCPDCGDPSVGRCRACQEDAHPAGALLVRAYDGDPDAFLKTFDSFGPQIQARVTFAVAAALGRSVGEVDAAWLDVRLTQLSF